MSLIHSPSITTNGLVLALDAGNIKSYPGSGTAWTDLTDTGNNGTLSNITYTATPNYMSFTSASNSGISLGTKLNYTTQDFSFSYWVYLDSYVTNQTGQGPVVFYKGNYQNFGYYNQITTGGAITFQTNQSGANQITNTASGALPVNTWTNVCITRSGASVKIYVNGVDSTTVAGTHIDPASSTDPFTIGYYAGAGFLIYGNMKISYFTNYNIALTANQVLQNFNAIRSRYNIVTMPVITQFVSSTSSSTNNLGSMPSYAAGDLLLLVAMQTGSSSESATPSGYTRINGGSSTGGVNAAGTMWYKIAGGLETPPSVSAGNICAMLVYRGVAGIGNSAVTAYNTTTTSFVYPTVAITGTSFVAGFAVNPTYNFSTPASTTLVEQFEDVASPTTGSHAIAIIPTAGEVSSWAGVTSTITSGRIGVAMSVEITT